MRFVSTLSVFVCLVFLGAITAHVVGQTFLADPEVFQVVFFAFEFFISPALVTDPVPNTCILALVLGSDKKNQALCVTTVENRRLKLRLLLLLLLLIFIFPFCGGTNNSPPSIRVRSSWNLFIPFLCRSVSHDLLTTLGIANLAPSIALTVQDIHPAS